MHEDLRSPAWSTAIEVRLAAWHQRAGSANARWWINAARAAIFDVAISKETPERAVAKALELAPREPFVLHHALNILNRQAQLGELDDSQKRNWQQLARHLALLRPLQTSYLQVAAQLLPSEELRSALGQLPVSELQPIRQWLSGYLPPTDFLPLLPKFYHSDSNASISLPPSWWAVIKDQYPDGINDLRWQQAPRPASRRKAADMLLRHQVLVPPSWQEQLEQDPAPNPWFADQFAVLRQALNQERSPTTAKASLLWRQRPTNFTNDLLAYRFYPSADWWLRAADDLNALRRAERRPRAVAQIKVAAAEENWHDQLTSDVPDAQLELIKNGLRGSLRRHQATWQAISGGHARWLWHRPGQPVTAPTPSQDRLRAVLSNGVFQGWLLPREQLVSHLLPAGPQNLAILPLP